jgi:hypothetical protein
MIKIFPLAAMVLTVGAHNAADAATWWILNSQNGICVRASEAVAATHDPAWTSPFLLAAESGRLGS